MADQTDMKTFEQFVEEKKIPAWLAAAVKAYLDLPVGREMTEAAFDKACDEVANSKVSAH